MWKAGPGHGAVHQSATVAAVSDATTAHHAKVAEKAGNRDARLTTTFHHPFYDETQSAFVEAKDLKAGDVLQTPTGTAEVTRVRLYHAHTTTYDLTIGTLHTYYVEAGTTPVLVHNCDDGELRDLHSKLPQRSAGGQTSGIARDGNGNTSSVITSDKGAHRNLIDRANSRLSQWGFNAPAARASDVEQKVAASMLNPDGSSRIASADLVINHPGGPCTEPWGAIWCCHISSTRGKRYRFTLLTTSGVWNSHVYQGLADFG
ncbi:polymorphic toxin-type HINT domain-containing protein [Streptomyces sp. NPDC048277]|uniref:polymorphic toxin-type HINT domain-containing protein n=1 Tax=Streptomyces sp. NPDC048277 TaxID=3155027 RepID=UPI0033D3D212